MNNILVLGYGQHVRRNIVPALIASAFVREIVVATSQSNLHGTSGQKTRFVSYETAKKLGSYDWVYVGYPIGKHFAVVKYHLFMGSNVICEKILTSSLKQTEELFSIASSMNLSLHEVAMYRYHSSYRAIKRLTRKRKNCVKHLRFCFEIPDLEPDDFRYNAELGGGAAFDIGYYPISAAVDFFGCPDEIKFKKLNWSEKLKVDLGGTATFVYGATNVTVNWAIGKEYKNSFECDFLDGRRVSTERFFTKPIDYIPLITVRFNEHERLCKLSPDNSFLNMFDAWLGQKPKSNKVEQEISTTLQTIRLVESLIADYGR